jgi:hypothetical protein
LTDPCGTRYPIDVVEAEILPPSLGAIAAANVN